MKIADIFLYILFHILKKLVYILKYKLQYNCSFDIITLYNTRGRKMIFYKVSHKCTVNNCLERKEVGIYSSEINATNAVESLKTKDGFK